ncbi:proline dehydrogenase family protein [Halalkalibacter krulwichiae]|uniref:proline dehydrogenase n=1 Tax=Halalkalibacter krulwichiae TaxID=199441 RepID=A0A1X9MFU7_9BACI|nr:proline dehydrogenase family protein [Halalkalibacter krulwichiae]ARK32286.1 Proline dehydrogenase 1 [Halalkalibacter krulwichiae]
MGLTKDFFIFLSQNKLLNNSAKKWGLKVGAQSVVAGTNIEEMVQSVKKLNEKGISATIDNLGEFVFEKEEATKATEQIIAVIEAIQENKLDAHISLKPTQLGLDIEYNFCLENLRKIVEVAHKYNIFINFDMEDHSHLQPSFDIIDELLRDFENIGTVIQAYFYQSQTNIEKYKGYRLRIAKGAYKEPESLAYQDKDEIDRNFMKLIEYHLLNGKFTSIATHDHNIINRVKAFVKEKKIPNEKFEFQMLYGFRKDLQLKLAEEGYNVCIYVPFGVDWYGYFMRRLAERPQNLNLVVKQMFNKRTNAVIGTLAGGFILGRVSKRRQI